MKLRSLLPRLAVAAASIGAAAVSIAPGQASAATAGDAFTMLFLHPGGGAGVADDWSYNSTGGGVTAGPLGVGVAYVDFVGITAGPGTAHLTMWHEEDATNDPICTIASVRARRSGTRITVRCANPVTGASLNDGRIQITYTSNHPTDASAKAGPGIVRLTTTSASAKAQTPKAQFRSSGRGGAIVYRQQQGAYQVRIPGGALLGAAGVAFTTAHGTSPRWCNPQGWYPVGADMYVDVRCFAPGGAPADAKFSMTLTRTNIFGDPTARGGSQFAPYSATEQTYAGWYGWNSAGTVNVTRNGTYTEDDVQQTYVQFGDDPDTIFGDARNGVAISGYGTHRCNMAWTGWGSAGYVYVVTRCTDATGALVSQAASVSKVDFS